MQMFSIRDIKAEAFARPFFSKNAPMAMREIQTAVNGSDNSMKTYADDFSLFHLGEFDEVSGTIISIEPRFLCGIADLVNKDTDAP